VSWYEQLHALHGDDHRYKGASGLTWAQIAEALKIRESTLYGWLDGSRRPSAMAQEMIQKLYEKMGPTGKEGNRRPRGAEGKA